MVSRWDFRPWFEQQAIDICQADICHAGGISELLRIAHYAEVYGILMAPHNPYGPVALAAAAHVAAAIQNFLILEHCPLQPWFDRLQRQPLPVTGGHIEVDELARRPGLGVELEEGGARRDERPHAVGPPALRAARRRHAAALKPWERTPSTLFDLDSRRLELFAEDWRGEALRGPTGEMAPAGTELVASAGPRTASFLFASLAGQPGDPPLRRRRCPGCDLRLQRTRSLL